MKGVNKKIPVMFEKVDQIDSRFQKVKIWLMHLGLNYNNSIFTKEVVEQAMESLKNTPILGYVEESRLGEKDFRGHEVEIVVEGGELKTKYIGQAFGVIPENCNPRFEFKKGDYGEELEYLVVDGLLWTKLEDGVNILNARGGEVAQSMELDDDFDGYWDEDGHFVFTRFSFYGACLLGKDVLPAMQQASVELSFAKNVDVYQEEIARKLREFQMAVNLKYDKEVDKTMTLEEVLAKYSTTVEELEEKGIDASQYSAEELDAKLADVFSDSDEGSDGDFQPESEDEGSGDQGGESGEGDQEDFSKSDDDVESLEDNGSDEASEKQDTFTLTFQLSHEDIRRKLYNGLDEYISAATGIEDNWCFIVSVYDEYFIAENHKGNFYKVSYTKDDDNVTFGEVVEVFPMFLTADEKNALDLMRSTYKQIEEENKELKEFKQKTLREQHEAMAEELFSKFNKLTAEEIADLRENVHNYSIEELESKLFERLGRKAANFTALKPSQSYSIKLKIDGTKEDVSGYAHILKKHGLI